jgi:hypothetical protein
VSDVSRMPHDRDIVIGHKVSSLESLLGKFRAVSHSHSRKACNLIIIILFLCVIHPWIFCGTQDPKIPSVKLQLPSQQRILSIAVNCNCVVSTCADGQTEK